MIEGIKTEVSIVFSRIARFQRLVAGFAARSEVCCGQKEMPSYPGGTRPGSGRCVPCDSGLQSPGTLGPLTRVPEGQRKHWHPDPNPR